MKLRFFALIAALLLFLPLTAHSQQDLAAVSDTESGNVVLTDVPVNQLFNSDILSKVMGIELWSDPINSIRIANLRPAK